MRARSLAVALAAVLVARRGGARAAGRGHGGHDRVGSWWNPPRDVRAMLDDVSAKNLRKDDLTLVGFGTRHTLSTQTDPKRGIGAARDWIKSQFDAGRRDVRRAHDHGRRHVHPAGVRPRPGADGDQQPVRDRCTEPTRRRPTA